MRTVLQRTSARMPRSLRSRALSNHNNDKTPAQQHALFREQMEELKQEREALYGFTDQEHQAWGSANRHKHSDDFLQQIEQARAEAHVAASRTPLQDSHHHSHNHHHHHHHNHSSDDTRFPDDPRGYTLLPPISQELPKDTDESDLAAAASPFTHLSADGSSVQMVHVGDKQVTARRAVAQTTVVFPPEIVQHGLTSKKGPIFDTAILAGIMAAKKTSDLIPLCHPLPLEQVHVDIQMRDAHTAVITCECHVTHKTGVEMEAMMGASVAALTIYDMVKAISHNVVVTETKLLHKSGGKRRID